VLSHLVPGEIVLMHLGSSRDHSTIDSKALPEVIRAVRTRGYRFVTLSGVRAP
jgi:peptidoglycan/xylan/chitin deacetylase (PgdA/CDA1 family)